MTLFDIIHKYAESCIINNGNYSKQIRLQCGCRQGDPWSPYLFILSTEPLAQCIKNAPNIEGLKIGNWEIKLDQYVDDTFLLLDNNATSISML